MVSARLQRGAGSGSQSPEGGTLGSLKRVLSQLSKCLFMKIT